MRPRTIAFVFVVTSMFALAGAWAQTRKSDGQIKLDIIAASISAYRGSCPCPYSVDRGGRRCGARSAYSRPGGAMPLCYEQDVSQKMVDDYRKRTGQ